MKKISCFVPYAGKEQVEKTIQGLQATGLVENIYLLTTNAELEAIEGRQSFQQQGYQSCSRSC